MRSDRLPPTFHDMRFLRQNTSLRSRPCFEECGCLCRLERVGSAVGDQIVATATRFSPAADLPCRHAILGKHQQHLAPRHRSKRRARATGQAEVAIRRRPCAFPIGSCLQSSAAFFTRAYANAAFSRRFPPAHRALQRRSDCALARRARYLFRGRALRAA